MTNVHLQAAPLKTVEETQANGTNGTHETNDTNGVVHDLAAKVQELTTGSAEAPATATTSN